MLTKTAAFTLACAVGLLSSTVSAEEAPAGDASPHSTSGNLTFTTNYVVRGLSQTNFKPAIQGTYEYAHASGVYAGLFASNVSWYGDGWEGAAPGVNGNIYGGTGNDAISSSLEIDIYGGYRGKIADAISYDVGAIYYYYPGQYSIASNKSTYGVKKPDTGEVYVGMGWNWVSAKLSYAVTDGVFGVADARGSYYGELNAAYPVGETGFNLIGHVGYWKFTGKMLSWATYGTDNSVYDFADYKIGVTKDFVGLTFGAFYTGTTADKTVVTPLAGEIAVWGNRFGKNVGDNAFFVTATKAF
jgi:uncharacterized protein (TIGR02001 family)